MEVFDRGLDHRTHPGDPRVVDSNVDGAERLDECVHSLPDLRVLAHVAARDLAGAPFGTHHLCRALRAFFVDVEKRQIRPVLRQPDGDGPPYTSRRTCNESDLPFQAARIWHLHSSM
jgi:hypothetical protein